MQTHAIILSGSPEWHEERRTGIGGSDAAAALGLSKFKTPYQLYLEKIGDAEPEDETWEMARGKALEPLLRQHYADTTGREVRTLRSAAISEKHSFMRYNPDGISEGRLVEFKTAAYGKEWGDEGSDEIPQEYLLQVQHGMIVTGFPVCDVTVSIAGNKPKYFEVVADRELQEMLIDAEADFWRKVLTREEPMAKTNEDVARMYRVVNGESIAATPEIQELMERLVEVRMAIKGLEKTKEDHEVTIKNFMGANEILLNDMGLPLATWKQQNGARRINADLLRKLHPDVAAEVTEQGDPLRRFLVK